MIQKIRNKTMGAFKNKKGFTLVEVIVVLVILAILAAILVPKLIGWIDQSKAKTATGEAHLVLSALQADASEQYGQGNTLDGAKTAASDIRVAAVNKYLQGDITLDGSNLKSVTYDTAKVTAFTFVASNGKTVTYSYSGNKGSFSSN